MGESVDRSFRQRGRGVLGNFFRSLVAAKPRWVSILHPVNDNHVTSLTHLLGFDHRVGLEFLLATGLIKKGSIRNPDGYAVVPIE